MAVTSDPTQIAAAIKKIAFAQQLAKAVAAMRNQGGGNPVGNNNGGGGGGSGVVASTLAGLPQSPLLDKLKAEGLIKEGMPAEQALAILKLGEIRGGVPLDVKTLTDQIKLDYENLTGDILDSGANWMREMYGNNTMPTGFEMNPNDPGTINAPPGYQYDGTTNQWSDPQGNVVGTSPAEDSRVTPIDDPYSALFAADPMFSSYAGGLAQIDETADANEATDLAWFQKQQGSEEDFITNLMQYTAAGGLNPTGGGGGGGGRGRGGGGGGGGSGGGDGDLGYGDTKTTERLRELFRIASGNTTEAENPGFTDEILGNAAVAFPEDFTTLQSLVRQHPDPEDLQPAIEDEMASNAGNYAIGLADVANNASWRQSQSPIVNDRMRMWMAQNGITVGDNPETPEIEPYYYSKTFANNPTVNNPNYGEPVDLSYGPPAGPASTGVQSAPALADWTRNRELFMQLYDPMNMGQSRNINGPQGEDLRDKIAQIAQGVRGIARTAVQGNPVNIQQHMAALQNPWSNLSNIMTTHANNPNTGIPQTVPPNNPIPSGPTTNLAPPADPNNYTTDPNTGYTWDPITDMWIDAYGSAVEAADASAAGQSPATVAPNTPVSTGPSSLFPTNQALQANLDQIIQGGGDVEDFLQYVYPTLPPNQRSFADLYLNHRGFDTPARSSDEQKVIELLNRQRQLQNQQNPTTLSGLMGGATPGMQIDPAVRAKLFANQNVTDLVNRAWQGLNTGDRMMDLRPDVENLLQNQDPSRRNYDAASQGITDPANMTVGAGDYYISGAPTGEYLSGLQRTMGVLRQFADAVESRNPYFNFVTTHANTDVDAQTDEQITSQATSYEDPAAALAFGGTGDFNDLQPDPLPGSITDINSTDAMAPDMPDMPAFTGYGVSAPRMPNNNSVINRLINGLNLQRPAPAATTGIGSAGRPQPTNAQRSQVSNLAGAFKQAALKQQAAPNLAKIRSLLAGVKKFG